jgi:hypothetical protein
MVWARKGTYVRGWCSFTSPTSLHRSLMLVSIGPRAAASPAHPAPAPMTTSGKVNDPTPRS